MDCCRNASVSNLDDLFSTQNTEVDVSLEWLSIFVEDCLTSPGNCLPPVAETTKVPQLGTRDPQPGNISKALSLLQKGKSSSSLNKFVVPGKARSKRKKRSTATAKHSNSNHFMGWSKHQNLHHMTTSSDPLLLQQAYWLADSELILPQKEQEAIEDHHETRKREGFDVEESVEQGQGQGQARRCTHCLSQRTPQWRAGPLGPKTLCNACGVRYKSGRLLPEYRPAKSPTFVTNLHSNSHKKVLEMRNMGVVGLGADVDDMGVLHSG